MKEKNKFGYAPFSEWKWQRYEGRKSANLDEFIEKNLSCSFFVGTDSQVVSRATVFTTALIAYNVGKGGTIIVHTDKAERMDQGQLRQRLMMETFRSLETAWYLDTKIPTESVISIHLDVNDSLTYKSNKYRDELVGLVMGQNFKPLTKPNSWASSSVADSRC